MNTNKTIMPIDRLLETIEKYFDCQLSDEQEEELRRQIAATPLSHPSIDEARAAMGFRKVTRRINGRGNHVVKNTSVRQMDKRGLMAGLSIAASIALIVTLGVMLLQPISNGTSQCVAYVNGQRVTDEDIVIALMAENTIEFNEGADKAQQSLINEFEFIAPVVDKYESNINPMEI